MLVQGDFELAQRRRRYRTRYEHLFEEVKHTRTLLLPYAPVVFWVSSS